MADGEQQGALAQRVAALAARVQRLKPVRVFQHYANARGPILASGLAYQAIFATFAGLWVGFSIAGLVIAGDIGLRTSLILLLAENVPGLIDTGGGSGAIDPDVLLEAGVFGWTGAVALVGLLVTAIGWLGSARDAVRTIFGLPPLAANLLLLKLKDLALAAAFGLALLVSAALSVAGTQATGVLLELVGIDDDSVLGTIAGRVVTLGIMFALDTAALAALYRVLSGVSVPWNRLRGGAALGALGLGILKVLGSALLGGAGSNPLLASFAVIIGLLIWFNLICQVVLLAAAWIVVGMLDAGLPIDEEVERQRLDEARRLVALHDAATVDPAPAGRLARVRARLARILRRR